MEETWEAAGSPSNSSRLVEHSSAGVSNSSERRKRERKAKRGEINMFRMGLEEDNSNSNSRKRMRTQILHRRSSVVLIRGMPMDVSRRDNNRV